MTSPHPTTRKLFSRVQLFVTPWTVAHQASLSIRFSRQEYWSGLPLLSPGDLPHPGIELGTPALQADTLPSEPPGNPHSHSSCSVNMLTECSKSYSHQILHFYQAVPKFCKSWELQLKSYRTWHPKTAPLSYKFSWAKRILSTAGNWESADLALRKISKTLDQPLTASTQSVWISPFLKEMCICKGIPHLQRSPPMRGIPWDNCYHPPIDILLMFSWMM